jgi:membrane-associated progesterone receptor component
MYFRSLDGMYGNFAGRDASRGMAKQSFDSGECLSGCLAMDLIYDPFVVEILTPIDQPLDKLDDLMPDEM